MRLLFALLCLLVLSAVPALAHGGRGCTSDANCRACRNCRYCAHCSGGGGTCGVCSPSRSFHAPSGATTVRHVTHTSNRIKHTHAPAIHKSATTSDIGASVLTEFNDGTLKQFNYLAPRLSTQYITDPTHDLGDMLDDDLTLLRNYPYARHGYAFGNRSLTSFFRRYTWYHPTTHSQAEAEQHFNKYERKNVDQIAVYQKGRRESGNDY